MRRGRERGNKEKRRAFLLSLLIHLIGLFLVIYAYVAPTPIEPENFIVLDLGAPEQATPSEAAAAEESAPQAAEPEVASESPGAPRTSEAEPAPAQAAQADAPQDAAQAQETPEDALTETPPATPPAPQASVPAPDASQPTDLSAQPATTTLPEVDDVQLEPQPLAEAVAIPRPSAAVSVPEARTLSVTPQVAVPAQVAVPEANAQVAVAEAQAVPQPQAQAQVPDARAVPTPEASASVPVRDIPQPQAQVTTPAAQPVPSPAAQAQVPEARPLATTPGVEVGAEVAVPSPQASATAPTAAAVPEVSPTAEVARPAPEADDTQTGTPTAQADANADGGNAPDTGQTTAQEDSSTEGAGAAAATAATTQPTGAPASTVPYEVRRSQPIAVVLDNALGYPQAGLLEASAVYEMPVEGGLTRLMSVYDNPASTPREVGPIRSAREYFVAAASAMNGTLVHVGGSPSALSEIARGRSTLNALEDTGPFFVASNQRAPYSTFASGSALRDAVARLELDASSVLSGSAYRPAERAPGAGQVVVNYSGDYSSGFRYVPQVAQYRWLRNGEEAADASGEDVLVDAVVTAQVTAFPYPGDPEGRLYLPYSGGAATLYLRGKALPGQWSPQDGFTFQADSGETIDLTPYKHWILFAPESAEVSAE